MLVVWADWTAAGMAVRSVVKLVAVRVDLSADATVVSWGSPMVAMLVE